jgi:hypothetical protein
MFNYLQYQSFEHGRRRITKVEKLVLRMDQECSIYSISHNLIPHIDAHLGKPLRIFENVPSLTLSVMEGLHRCDSCLLYPKYNLYEGELKVLSPTRKETSYSDQTQDLFNILPTKLNTLFSLLI